MTYRRSTLSDSYKNLLEKKRTLTGAETDEYKKVFRHIKFIYKKDKDMISQASDSMLKDFPRTLFQHDSIGRISWDILMLFLILYVAISVPFYICFYFPITGSITIVEFLVQIIMILDILVTANTSYTVKGTIITSRKKIICRYLKGWFWIDILSGFPYNWLYSAPLKDEEVYTIDQSFYKLSQILKIVRMLRIFRALKLIKIIKAQKILNSIEESLVNNKVALGFIFGKLITFMILVAHWLACVWNMNAIESDTSEEITWQKIFFSQSQSEIGTGEIYVTALYWAFTTMVSVGYGDIHPISKSEMIIGIITMASSSTIFAYIIGTFNSLITSATAQETSNRDIIIAVNRYMKKAKLNSDLQYKVRSYLDHIFQSQNKFDLAEESIMQMLSLNLKDEIYTHLHGNIVTSCHIFEEKSGLSKMTLSQIHRILKFETFAPKDIIFKQGETSRILYFILSGKVDLFHQSTKYSYITLQSRMCFGEIGFFIGKPRTTSAKCLNFTEFFSISFEEFSGVIANTSEDIAKMDKLKLDCEGDDFSSLFISCYMCNKLGHIANNCNLIVFNFDKEAKKVAKTAEVNKSKKVRVNNLERRKIVGKRKALLNSRKHINNKNSLSNKINNFNFGREESLNVIDIAIDSKPKRFSFIYNITESSHEEDNESRSDFESQRSEDD